MGGEMIRVDLTGIKFTRLKVLGVSHFEGKGKKRAVFWLCLCTCGTEIAVRMNGLTSGHAKSCGCLKREKAALQGKSCRTHGRSHTTEHNRYLKARQRCVNPKETGYKYYGGRGIRFLFTSFEQFFAELGTCPKGLTLDRINTNGNYEPGNVRWATLSQQNKNRRPFAKKLL
jgi:hypothetical protein